MNPTEYFRRDFRHVLRAPGIFDRGTVVHNVREARVLIVENDEMMKKVRRNRRILRTLMSSTIKALENEDPRRSP